MKYLIVALLSCSSLLAQARTEQQESPFNVIVENDCGAESVAITGTIYGTVTATGSLQMSTFHTSWGPRGDVKAIGLVSGNTYNVVGRTNFRWMSTDKGITTWGYVSNFNIVGLYDVRYAYVWQIIDEFRDGEWYTYFRTKVDNFKAVCH